MKYFFSIVVGVLLLFSSVSYGYHNTGFDEHFSNSYNQYSKKDYYQNNFRFRNYDYGSHNNSHDFRDNFSSQNTFARIGDNFYYIGDVVECRHMVFTCEYGYMTFSNTQGCGCEKWGNFQEQEYYDYVNNLHNRFSIPRDTPSHLVGTNNKGNFRVIQSYGSRASSFSRYDSRWNRPVELRELDLRVQKIVDDFFDEVWGVNYSRSGISFRIESIVQRLHSLWERDSRYRYATDLAIEELLDYERNFIHNNSRSNNSTYHSDFLYQDVKNVFHRH